MHHVTKQEDAQSSPESGLERAWRVRGEHYMKCNLMEFDLRIASLFCAILSLHAPLQSLALDVDEPAAKIEQSGAAILPDGTAIELRITKTLSTAHAKVGDPVEFEVVHDVKVVDLVVIPRHPTT